MPNFMRTVKPDQCATTDLIKMVKAELLRLTPLEAYAYTTLRDSVDPGLGTVIRSFTRRGTGRARDNRGKVGFIPAMIAVPREVAELAGLIVQESLDDGELVGVP